jgi:hypothetical protein
MDHGQELYPQISATAQPSMPADSGDLRKRVMGASFSS